MPNATQYSAAIETIRFFLEHRLKLFGFVTVVNGAVLALAFGEQRTPEWSRPFLPGFAFLLTGMCLLAELRATGLYREALDVACNLEDPNGGFATKMRAYAEARPLLSFRITFRVLYVLIMVWWGESRWVKS